MYVPRHFAEDNVPTLHGFMARANPQRRGFGEEALALAIFQGPHAYISPSWYDSKQVVPTWNYAAVHAYGAPRIIEDHDATLAVLERLVAENESAMAEPWRIDSQTDAFRDAQMRGITAFEIPITRLEGKYKLAQNKPEADRLGTATALRETGDAHALELARMMEACDESEKD